MSDKIPVWLMTDEEKRQHDREERKRQLAEMAALLPEGWKLEPTYTGGVKISFGRKRSFLVEKTSPDAEGKRGVSVSCRSWGKEHTFYAKPWSVFEAVSDLAQTINRRVKMRERGWV